MKNLLLAVIMYSLMNVAAHAAPTRDITMSALGVEPITQTTPNSAVLPQKHRKKTASAVKYSSNTMSVSRKYSAGKRPGKWCGWYMRTIKGGGPEYNLARNWAKRGRPSGPQVGAVVVWRSHVGIIVGRANNGRWLVHSGNTAGGRIATKPRSVAGAIAFRMI